MTASFRYTPALLATVFALVWVSPGEAGDLSAKTPIEAKELIEPEPAIVPYVSYIYDYFHNTRGGRQIGGAGMGVVDMGFEADLEALLGWERTIFFMNAFAGHGSDFSNNFAGDLSVVSNIYTDTNFNFFNIYLQKGFGPGDSYFRIGQIAVDEDFKVSDTAELFINSAFVPFNTQSANVGAPIYPLAAPGGLIHLAPTEDWHFRAAIYAGDAGPGGPKDRGFEWRWGGAAGVAIFVEGGVLLNDAGGVLSLGGFYHTGEFEVFATGMMEDGLGAVYFMIDQPIIDPGDGGVGLGAFVRGSLAPDESVSLATDSIDGGFVLNNVLLPDANFGVAFKHTSFGEDYLLANPGLTGSESILEVTYQIPVTDHFTIQPDLQLIFDPHTSGRDAVVVGFRGEVSF